jgi:hypothetical protein
MKMNAMAKPKSDPEDGSKGDQLPNRLIDKDWHDPLHMLHEYILEHSEAAYSIASDDDAVMLMKLVGEWKSHAELRHKMWQAAKKYTKTVLDNKGVATLDFATTASRKTSKTKAVRDNLCRSTKIITKQEVNVH